MSTLRHHNEWLRLLDVAGPFLSMPVLQKALPQGLDTIDSELRARLLLAYEEWQEPADGLHRQWVRFVLAEVLGLPAEMLTEAQGIPTGLDALVPEHAEVLRPDLVLVGPVGDEGGDVPRLLISVYPPDTRLEHPLVRQRWLASPVTRMFELLRRTSQTLGLVTNGEQWCLVYAPPRETVSYASWYASLWGEEPLTLRSFVTLLGARRFFNVPTSETLEALLVESAQNQHDVTDQLGEQCRQAIEVLINTLDRADQDRGRALLREVTEQTLYEAAVTVMMRLIFLLCAEERELLPVADPFYQQHYAISTLSDQLRDAAALHGEEVLERRHDAWCRLLATFRVVHAGVNHDRLQLMAYGSRLFDPDAYPLLEGRPSDTSWKETAARPLPVDNRTVLHLLEALQFLEVRLGGETESRRLSFKGLGVEQIGHVYEGLLDHMARRAPEPTLGLECNKGKRCELAVSRLEDLLKQGQDKLAVRLKEETGKQETTILKALHASVDNMREHRLQMACQNDQNLLERVLPYAMLMRQDSRGYPVLTPKGGFYVTTGSDRRSTGTHYTPRSLTEPIVQYALEPLVYIGPAEGLPAEAWQLKPAKEILALRICDMAMGSGAFLVQTCRYMSERLAEAWKMAEDAHPGCPGITPHGDASRGERGEALIPKDTEERLACARRLIADQCLYGVDINPMAVEMAKLSLWLVTLQKDRPFTFLDHALKCGDSLLGLTQPEQIERFHMDPSRGADELFTQKCGPALQLALRKRRELEELTEIDIDDVHAKAWLLKEAEAASEQVRVMADLIVGAALSTAGKKGGKALDERLRHLAPLVAEALRDEAVDVLPFRLQDLRDKAEEMLQAGTREGQPKRRPFHWVVEFPEVFAGEVRGFDGVVGNPPFVGGQKITGALGTDYRDHLVDWLGRGQRGSADLCAFFFLRAFGLLYERGNLGLVATNTIAQGDTREVSLEQLVQDGCIYRAVPSQKWPGQANLEVAEVWVHRGRWQGSTVLENAEVRGITPMLVVRGNVMGKPYRLAANGSRSFQGSNLFGTGFILTSEEAARLHHLDPIYKEVVVRYLSGEDLNSRPDQSPSRWVINFRDWPIEQAQRYHACFDVLERLVLPERLRVNRAVYRERWWQFAERRVELYNVLPRFDRVLVAAQTTKYLSLSFQPVDQVFAVTCIVLTLPEFAEFSQLNSIFHAAWIEEHASSLETRLRYIPSDCFETFPFPAVPAPLESIGERYYTHRQQIMLTRQEGLTKTYNRFHNPQDPSADIATLRQLHVEMDQAVAAAYDWTDLDLGHGFHQTKQGLRYTISEPARREVLDRLLELNHARYAEEVAQGFHSKPGKKKAKQEPAAVGALS